LDRQVLAVGTDDAEVDFAFAAARIEVQIQGQVEASNLHPETPARGRSGQPGQVEVAHAHGQIRPGGGAREVEQLQVLRAAEGEGDWLASWAGPWRPSHRS
jgi:hypothetical protein